MSKIPKIIHITSKEKTETNQIFINYLKKLHPDFTVKYYDDLKCMEVLEKKFGHHFVNRFKKIKNGAHKADYFRYAVLYLEGGYYIDTDNWPSKRLDAIDDGGCDLISVVWKMKKTFPEKDKYHKNHIHNGFIACVKNLDFIKDLFIYSFNNPDPKEAHQLLEPYLNNLYYYVYCRYFYIKLLELTDDDELLSNKKYISKKLTFKLLSNNERFILYCKVDPPIFALKNN